MQQSWKQSIFGWWMLVLLSFCGTLDASSKRNSNHHYHHDNGILPTSLSTGNPPLELNGEAIIQLKSGKPYKTQTQRGDVTIDVIVQDVMANVNIVWDRVLDFNHYTEMMYNIYESEIIQTQYVEGGKQNILVRMKSGNPVMKVQYYIDHYYNPIQNSLTWTLDTSRTNDIDNMIGFWYIVPHPDNSTNWTRLYYSVQVSIKSQISKIIFDYTSQRTLSYTTASVKKYSELLASNIQNEQRGGGKSINPEETSMMLIGKNLLTTWFNRVERTNNVDNKDDTINEDVCDNESCQLNNTANPSEQQPVYQPKIGLKRYALISSIIALSLYNIHLYFSQ
jgi:hypothetical protein